MKTFPAVFLMLCLCQSLFAQKMASDYFAEGEQYIENDDYTNALVSFQYIVDHYPKNVLYPRAFYNTGYILYETKEYDSCMVVFKAILNSNFNEKESSGGGIMDDPYTNYRHRACEVLSSIYNKKEQYDSALHYFALADTLYPYIHFCGNEYATNDIRKALKYAELYQKLDNKDKAIESLLQAVFIDIEDNSQVLTELKHLLKGHKNLQNDLNLALTNMYPKTITREEYSYTLYYIKFLNAEIDVPVSSVRDNDKFDKDNAIAEIRKTEFYKMIKGL